MDVKRILAIIGGGLAIAAIIQSSLVLAAVGLILVAVAIVIP